MRHEWKNLKNKKLQTAGVICLVFLVALIGYRFYNSQKKGRPPMEMPQVAVYELQRGDMQRHINLTGQTVADATIALAPKYAGKVTAVNVQLGDTVEEGQILLVQDTEDLDIAIQQGMAAAEASSADAVTEEANFNSGYLKAEAAFGIQAAHYERQQYLFSIGAISQDALDKARNEYVSAQAAYEALANQHNGSTPASVRSKQLTALKNKYSVDALRKQREDMIIRAPRAGVIGYRNAEVGSYLSPGSKVLTLVDNSHIYVDCALSEQDAAVLETGMAVTVTIDALGKSYQGKLVYVSPSMGDDSKTYTARISLEAAKTEIKAGLFARSAVDILQRENALCVPKEAVLTKNGQTTVYVYQPETQTVVVRQVALGLLNDSQMEIISGLQPGEMVVISNQDRLQDGMQVKLQDEADRQAAEKAGA